MKRLHGRMINDVGFGTRIRGFQAAEGECLSES